MSSMKITDIESVVLKWAKQDWNTIKKHLDSKEIAKIPTDQLHFDINFDGVMFSNDQPKPPENETADSKAIAKGRTVFKTDFENHSQKEQVYSFKTERRTKSICTVNITHGVTNGFTGNLKLNLPGSVFEANAGFSHQINVQQFRNQTTEEELSWSVDSEIKVPSQYRTEAKVVISEDEYNEKLKLKCYIEGNVAITVRNANDNNSFVCKFKGNIAEIFRQAEKKDKPHGYNLESGIVEYETLGEWNFRYGVGQHVKLTQFPMEEKSITAEGSNTTSE